MSIQRLIAVVAVLCAALFVSGCYVTSPVAPTAAEFDQRLVGPWVGFGDKGKISPGAFLHFVEGTEKKEPRLVMLSPKGVAVYDLRTLRVKGNRGAFAIKRIMADAKDGIPDGYLLGFYEIRGDKLWIDILSSKAVGKLVDEGKVKGVKTQGDFFDVKLTGSADEIAQFLTSPEARATADGEGTILARRLAVPRR